MKQIITEGTICIKSKENIVFSLCKISYILNSDETFSYIFEPDYSVMALLNSDIFQGIPGLNLDLKKDKYIRNNIIPTFISERVPQINRVDYQELLSKVGMDVMNPIEFLIRWGVGYCGDNLFVTKYRKKEAFNIDLETGKSNIFGTIKTILNHIASGDIVHYGNVTIDDSNKAIVYAILLKLYQKGFLSLSKLQKEGIYKGQEKDKYRGRKPIEIDRIHFLEVYERIKKKEITPKEGSHILKISLSKYYRLLKEYKNNVDH